MFGPSFALSLSYCRCANAANPSINVLTWLCASPVEDSVVTARGRRDWLLRLAALNAVSLSNSVEGATAF